MHQIGIVTKNDLLEIQYVVTAKKDTSRKLADLNTENDKNLKKLLKPKRAKEPIPTSQKV